MRDQRAARALAFVTALVRWLLAAVAASFIGIYVFIALSRMPYPYALEWMEGGSLEQVARILDGQRLYIAPSIDFIPYIYTPGYFYVAAGAAWMGGAGFATLRLVSFVASLGCFTLIFVLVRHETGRTVFGLVSAGLFAAMFGLSGGWYDLARVDSLFMALLLAGVVTLRLRAGSTGQAAAAALFFLSFMTKQPALIVAAAMAPAIICTRSGRSPLVFPLALALLLVVTVATYNAATDGWFWYYVVTLPASHEPEWPMLRDFWSHDIAAVLSIAVVLTAVFVVSRDPRGRRVFYGALFAGLVLTAWLSRMHSGGYSNVLMPLHAALAIGAGLGLAAARDTRFETIAALACLIQFAQLSYSPTIHIPTSRDREAGDRIVATLRTFKGDVLLPNHEYLARLAGKRTFASGMEFDDVRRSSDTRLGLELEAAMRAALEHGRFDALLLDPTGWDGFDAEVNVSYRPERRLLDDPDLFMPRTGMPTRPNVVCVPRRGG
ncbi:MAG TPA: hypothetical protein VF147_01010 [Vicinamibacterales bacterium]